MLRCAAAVATSTVSHLIDYTLKLGVFAPQSEDFLAYFLSADGNDAILGVFKV